MKIIIGGQYYSTLDAQSIQITSSATDPVPTCTLDLIDNSGTMTVPYAAELLVLDDQQVPNATINLARGPDMNPYTSYWVTTGPPSGVTLSTVGGGGVEFTFSNTASVSPTAALSQSVVFGSIVGGQTYMFSVQVQGASSPSHIGACIFVVWKDAGNNTLSTISFNGPIPTSTSLVQYTVSGTAPATAVTATMELGYQTNSATNSGTITFTQAQMEPKWFPTVTYPTPWCGPSQTNCQQLPLGYWIRQYRRFAGFVTHIVAQNYHGNVRTLQVDASGYALLCDTILCNNSFTNQTDAAIITSLANTYLANSGLLPFSIQATLVSLTNVIAGQNVSNLQSNWDSLRTLFDGLASNSGFYWTIDYYWNLIYAPPGYLSQGIGLILDDSGPPDNVLTFPGYEFSAESDFTQPGSSVLCLGSGTNVSLVMDPTQTAQLGYASGYYLLVGQSWMRKVNDSTLGSTTDTTSRAQAEMLQFDFPRSIYHVKTQVELKPGQSVQLTSATEGLSASTQLVQQTTGKWLGTDETLKDVWEYQSDLGAINRRATNMISRIFRQTQKGTSAPAISVTTLAVSEKAGLAESISTSGSLISNYAQSILPDGPLGLWPLGELTGTIADDVSGNALQGTIAGGVTMGVAGLLTDPADTAALAMTFGGVNGVVTFPTASFPTGNGHFSVEIWASCTAFSAGNQVLWFLGGTVTAQSGVVLAINSTGHLFISVTGGSTGTATGAISTGTAIYVVMTWDGTTLKGYLNGNATPFASVTPGALSIAYGSARIGLYGDGTSPWNGRLQYPGIYLSALSTTQIGNHNTAGT